MTLFSLYISSNSQVLVSYLGVIWARICELLESSSSHLHHLLLLLSRFSRVQPTRLPCPWDSPGKNTGVGCHFLLQCMKVKSEREVSHVWLFATPWIAAHQAPPSMGFSRQEYWSGITWCLANDWLNEWMNEWLDSFQLLSRALIVSDHLSTSRNCKHRSLAPLKSGLTLEKAGRNQ